MTSPMNVYNQDGFPSIANALLFGTTLVPLNQSTATTGFIPQIQTNRGLTLTAPSGLGITWANVLTAGNTSGANNAIMSAGRALNFADGTVKINGTVGGTNTIAVGNAAVGISTRDIAFGSSATTTGTAGSAQERIAIGVSATAGAGSVNYSIALGSLASSTATSSIAIGRAATATGLNAVSIGSSTTSLSSADIAIGQNCVATGAGAHSRISIGQDCIAGAAGQFYSIAVGSQSNSTSTNTIAIGRLTRATHTNSVALGVSATTTAANQIMIGNNAAGGTNQVFLDVGAAGTVTTPGYVATVRRTEARISAAGTQTIPASTGSTGVSLPIIDFTSDNVSPSITSSPHVFVLRQFKTIVGVVALTVTWASPTFSAFYQNVSIWLDVNGVLTLQSVVSDNVVAGTNDKSYTVPFCINNQAAITTGIFVKVFVDNNEPISDLTISAATHMQGCYLV